MDVFSILKETAKKAPIPTAVSAVIYGIFSKIIDLRVSESLLALIAVLTFFVLLLMMFFFGRGERSNNFNAGSSISENTIEEVRSSAGDIFIGEKAHDNPQKSNVTRNKISKASAKGGDVFIGEKSERGSNNDK